MNIEDAQNRILELEEQLQDYENLKTELDKKEERIKSLEEHNQKLFLRATSTLSKDEGTQENNDDLKELLGEYVNLLDNEEIENLKEIMEEL